MRYEYDISQVTEIVDAPRSEPGQMTVGPAGLGRARDAMNTRSHDRWDLVTAHVDTEQFTSDLGNPRERVTVTCIWRRLVEDN